MKHLIKMIVGSLIVIASSGHGMADIVMRVAPAYAPNGAAPNESQSPSWEPFVQNAIVGLSTDQSSIGDRTIDPAAYQVVDGPITPFEMIYTNYPSWRASASPFKTWEDYPTAFATEQGNRIHFGVQIESNGSRDFALQELSWALDSDDDTNYFDQQGSFANAAYSKTRVGTNYGADGQPGGGDDLVYDDGQSGALRIHELTYIGVGDGFFSQEPSPTSNLDDIDATLRSLLGACTDCAFGLTATYTLSQPDTETVVTGSGSVEVLLQPGFGSDFNRNFSLDSGDLDLLTPQIDLGSTDILYDLDRNGIVEFEDLRIAVQELHYTFFGDANDDGEFTSDDLIQVFVAGLYENDEVNDAVWSTGDWNGDREFSSTDIVFAFQDAGYEQGPRPAIAAAMPVPEPSTALLMVIALSCVVFTGLRQKRYDCIHVSDKR